MQVYAATETQFMTVYREVAVRQEQDAIPSEWDAWQRFHKHLLTVLRRYCSVEWDGEPDIFFTGDWFHVMQDGFALQTIASLAILGDTAILHLQSAIIDHHTASCVIFQGDVDTPLDGLEIMVTASCVLVRWDGLSSEACCERLQSLAPDLSECAVYVPTKPVESTGTSTDR